MNPSPHDHKDPLLADILRSTAPSKAPDGLADKLMLSVEAVALRRKKVRKNLRIAMTGVGSTLVLMLTWLVGGKAWVEDFVSQNVATQTEFSSAIMISITMIGMIALFVELEIVVKYWWQWRRLQPKA